MLDLPRITPVLAIALLTLGIAGCRWNKEREAKAAELAETGQKMLVVKSRLWRVTELAGKPVPEDAGITVQLLPGEDMVTTDDKVVGNTGVNQYTGGYKIAAPDQVSFSNLVTTRSAGPPEAMAREQTFLNVMDQVRSFEMHEHPGHRTVDLRDAKKKIIMRAMTRD